MIILFKNYKKGTLSMQEFKSKLKIIKNFIEDETLYTEVLYYVKTGNFSIEEKENFLLSVTSIIAMVGEDCEEYINSLLELIDIYGLNILNYNRPTLVSLTFFNAKTNLSLMQKDSLLRFILSNPKYYSLFENVNTDFCNFFDKDLRNVDFETLDEVNFSKYLQFIKENSLLIDYTSLAFQSNKINFIYIKSYISLKEHAYNIINPSYKVRLSYRLDTLFLKFSRLDDDSKVELYNELIYTYERSKDIESELRSYENICDKFEQTYKNTKILYLKYN